MKPYKEKLVKLVIALKFFVKEDYAVVALKKYKVHTVH